MLQGKVLYKKGLQDNNLLELVKDKKASPRTEDEFKVIDISSETLDKLGMVRPPKFNFDVSF